MHQPPFKLIRSIQYLSLRSFRNSEVFVPKKKKEMVKCELKKNWISLTSKRTH
jgi:hypothetical protein